MKNFSASPKEMLACLFRNRNLIAAMVKRDVVGRYRGSVMGLTWSFLNPLLMLVVYTFVFSEVFKSRWPGSSDSKVDFSIILFVGLILFNIVAESFNRAPGIIIANVNYVKKVVFPLEILPVVAIGSSLFHALISLIILAVTFLIFNGFIHWTALLLPVTLLPLLMATLGISWFFASLGVFLRDLGQTVAIFTTVLMFLSPLFYPVSSLPEHFQSWVVLNPLAFNIEQTRQILIWGNWPDWSALGTSVGVSALVMWAGFAWFQKTRKGFADVL